MEKEVKMEKDWKKEGKGKERKEWEKGKREGEQYNLSLLFLIKLMSVSREN